MVKHEQQHEDQRHGVESRRHGLHLPCPEGLGDGGGALPLHLGLHLSLLGVSPERFIIISAQPLYSLQMPLVVRKTEWVRQRTVRQLGYYHYTVGIASQVHKDEKVGPASIRRHRSAAKETIDDLLTRRLSVAFGNPPVLSYGRSRLPSNASLGSISPWNSGTKEDRKTYAMTDGAKKQLLRMETTSRVRRGMTSVALRLIWNYRWVLGCLRRDPSCLDGDQ